NIDSGNKGDTNPYPLDIIANPLNLNPVSIPYIPASRTLIPSIKIYKFDKIKRSDYSLVFTNLELEVKKIYFIIEEASKVEPKKITLEKLAKDPNTIDSNSTTKKKKEDYPNLAYIYKDYSSKRVVTLDYREIIIYIALLNRLTDNSDNAIGFILISLINDKEDSIPKKNYLDLTIILSRTNKLRFYAYTNTSYTN
ncbi:hypothetical protein N7505_007150, partial [Penicillium chrysogenum]